MERRAAWDLYWHSDRVASCMDGGGRHNYDHRIGAGWRHFLNEIPAGSRILDLCTGNGAVAVMAVEYGAGEGKDFAVTGVDLARIDPCRFVSCYGGVARSITFIGDTDCADLPFADGSFDCVVSQYGIEYTDLSRSLPEAVRVMAPGGKLRFGLHAREGTVVGGTRAALADADFLVDEIDLFARAEHCLTTLRRAEGVAAASPADAAAADRAIESFQSVIGKASRRAALAVDETMMRNCADVIVHCFDHRRHFPLEVLVEKVREARDEVLAHRCRQRALVAASRSADDVLGMCETLSALGLQDVSSKPQRPGDEFVGYVVRGSKP